MTIRTLIKGLVMIVLVITIYLLNEYVFNLRPSQLRTWISSFGLYAPLIFLLACIGRPFVLFPTSVLSIAGGLVFGPYLGTVLTIVGGSTGALLFFLAARKMGFKVLPDALRRRGKKLEKGLSEQGFSYVLLLRLVPFLHFDLVSYVCGVSDVDKKKYYLATLLGMLPGALALNFLGASFLSNNITTVVIAACFLLLVLLVTLYIRKRAFGSEMEKEI